jgi:chitinase
MSMRPILVVLAVAFAALSSVAQSPARIVGYFPSWGIYARNYHVPNIPAAQLTHVNYAFANVQNGVVVLGDYYADVDKWYPGDCWNPGCRRGSFQRLRVLKQQFPHLRTLISIGGWTWSANFSDAVLTPAARATFAQSIVDFVDLHEFDGADIDWEYPVAGGLPGNVTRPQDKQNYTAFLIELRARFNTRALTTGKTYLLTIAAPANPAYIANYELPLIAPVLDWINLMSYDLRGPWGDPFTGFNAPLYADPQEPVAPGGRAHWNVAAAVQNYLVGGVPAHKLHVGTAFYGRGFGGVPSNAGNGLYQTYTAPSAPGTWENGVYDYTDLAANYENHAGWVKTWHPQARAPWLWNAAQQKFIGYDDPRSIAEKAWHVNQWGLGGAMFWELSGDRNAALLGTLDLWLRQRASLRATVGTVSLAAPTRVDLAVRGTAARAGRGHLTLFGLTGTFPGLPLQGSWLPLNYDFLVEASAATAGSALFPGTIGLLDAQGNAAAAIDFTQAPVLPPVLLGFSVHACTWLLAIGAGNGEPTNSVEIRFVP